MAGAYPQITQIAQISSEWNGRILSDVSHTRNVA